MSRLERITSDPAVCHGQPMIRGLRYTVESLLELWSAGMTTSSPRWSSVRLPLAGAW